MTIGPSARYGSTDIAPRPGCNGAGKRTAWYFPLGDAAFARRVPAVAALHAPRRSSCRTFCETFLLDRAADMNGCGRFPLRDDVERRAGVLWALRGRDGFHCRALAVFLSRLRLYRGLAGPRFNCLFSARDPLALPSPPLIQLFGHEWRFPLASQHPTTLLSWIEKKNKYFFWKNFFSWRRALRGRCGYAADRTPYAAYNAPAIASSRHFKRLFAARRAVCPTCRSYR